MNYGEGVPQIFLPVLIWLISCLPGMQELVNCFLNFSQKELVHVLSLSRHLFGVKKSEASYSALPLITSSSCWFNFNSPQIFNMLQDPLKIICIIVVCFTC